MDSRTPLEQAVFQLTPTRTRCDLLVVSRDGKREKIASGLVAPFLTHLKSARDQIPKGGYSFGLRPPSPPASGGDFGSVGWFTKGVVEKFVRFVAAPEIVERVVTIEKEIVEIDEEIGRAMVPSSLNHPEASSLTLSGENSKQSLLLVHENRKKMLQKEQGMSYARACILGYERNNLDDLIAFSDAFGASRFREACISFKELCFEKEKDNLWADELEALRHSQFASMPNNGIILTAETDKSNIDGNDQNAGLAPDLQGKPQFPMGWFNHHPNYMYPPYHGHMPANSAPYQGYPYPGMPFMPPYQTHYAQSHDESHVERRISESGSEFGDNGASENKSNKKSSRKVVIRNINYISKGKHSESSYDSSYDEDEDEVDEEFLQKNVEQVVDSFKKHRGHSNRHKHRSKSHRRNRSEEAEEDAVNNSGEKKTGGGGWDAFQNILMKDETETEADQKPDVDIIEEFSANKSDGLSRSTSSDYHHFDEELGKGRRQKITDIDPLVMNGRDAISDGGRRIESFENGDDYHRSIINRRGQNQNEEFLLSQMGNSKINTSSDNFANYANESPSIQICSESDWLVVDEYSTKPTTKGSHQDTLLFQQDLIQRSQNPKKIEHVVPSFDDSIVVPDRSCMVEERRSSLWETDMSIMSGLASTHHPPLPQTSKDHQPVKDFQEPDDLQMVFRRDLEVKQVTEQDIDAEFTHVIAIEKNTPVEPEANIVIKKEPVAKTIKKLETVKKTKSFRPPLTKRTESLPRNRKLANMSKEAIQLTKAKQEEANRKRIEELNLERQRRIAERSGRSSTTVKTKQSDETKGNLLAMERLKLSQQNKQNGFGSSIPQRPSGSIRKI